MRGASIAAFALLALAGLTGCTPEDTTRPSPSVEVTVSGETLALGGYAFPPATDADVAFVDGWEVRFDEVLVTIDHVTLSDGPDQVSTDQSRTGPVVAEASGPWAVDLHAGGPLTGKGGPRERAVSITTLTAQTENGGKQFEADKRYAFGFGLAVAQASAERVNLSAQASTDYDAMVRDGVVILYVGTATFRGTRCTPAADAVLAALPTVVHFRLGFKTPATYVNCQNPDNDPAQPFADEEHQRGLAVRPNAATVAQITVHTDHPFWESVRHDSPAHFDPLAAVARAGDGGAEVTLDDARGVDFTAFRTATGKALSWRTCVDASRYAMPTSNPMSFGTPGVAVDASGPPESALRDYADFMAYDQSTQGHLNSDGLCFVERGYPSPP
jgi:hypothetical protein